MRKDATLVLMFTGLLLVTGIRIRGKEEARNPEELISRARAQEEVWTEGTPPMLMRAEIQVQFAGGALVRGGYALYWVSPSRWREEIRFRDYERIRVRDANGYWQKSNTSYEPEFIFQLDKLLHLKEALSVGPKQTLGKVVSRKKDGVVQNCTEVKWSKDVDRKFCFDEATGVLASVEYPVGEHQNPPEISRIEYGAFTSVAGKNVPYEIQALNGQKVVLSAKVLEVSKITEENPALFNAPANAEFWAQCDPMQKAVLLNSIQPKYPTGARANHEQGRVIFYVVVEADGSLSHATIIRHATPDLDAAATEALRQWRYKPASCGEKPIRIENSIDMDFWLGVS